jgi:hypothetical protein
VAVGATVGVGVAVGVGEAAESGVSLGVGTGVAVDVGDAEGMSVDANAGAVAPTTVHSSRAPETAKAAAREERGSMGSKREKCGQCCPTVRRRGDGRQRPFGGGVLGQNRRMHTTEAAR